MWQPVTFDAMWRDAVAADPAALFLRFEDRHGDVTEWTYGEFDRVVEGAAARLVAAGVTGGSAVHLALTNSPTFVAVWLAAVRLGAWIVPSDPQATAPELAEHIAADATGGRLLLDRTSRPRIAPPAPTDAADRHRRRRGRTRRSALVRRRPIAVGRRAPTSATGRR